MKTPRNLCKVNVYRYKIDILLICMFFCISTERSIIKMRAAIPWKSPLQRALHDQEQVQSVLDHHLQEAVAPVIPPQFCDNWSIIYQCGLITMSLISAADLYFVLYSDYDITCLGRGYDLFSSLTLSAAIVFSSVLLYYATRSLYARYNANDNFWIIMAKFLVRSFLLIWIMLGGSWVLSQAENPCDITFYLYLQISFSVKIMLVIFEFAWSLKTCPK